MDDPTTPPTDPAQPDDDDFSRVWGSEGRLPGRGWRPSQEPGPVEPPELRASRHRGPAADPEPEWEPLTPLEAIVSLRRQSDARLSEIEVAVSTLTRAVREAAWSTSGTEVRNEMNELRASIAEVRTALGGQEAGRVLTDLVRVEAERIRAIVTETESAMSEQWGGQLERIREELGLVDSAEGETDRRRALERIRKEIETMGRSLAELRTSLPGANSDELGALVQEEARATRDELSRLRSEGTGGVNERLDALVVQVESVRGRVNALAAALKDTPTSEALVETIESTSERGRNEIQDFVGLLRSMLEDLRTRTDRVDEGLTELTARFEATRTDSVGLTAVLRSETDRIRGELAQANQSTDARARNVMSTLAKELLALGDQQRALREEIRKLAAKLPAKTRKGS